MTDYGQHFKAGLYREETGLVCSSGDITVSAPVSWNIHSDLRNKPHATETFNLGVAWLRNTTDSTWNTADITAVSGSAITIGATHNGDSFNIGYYATATGVTAATQAVRDSDIWRPEHWDELLKVYDQKGNLNPLECGLVYDQCMGYATNSGTLASGAPGTAETLLSYETGTGTWSHNNKRPIYVASIRLEAQAGQLDTAKGLIFRIKDDTTDAVEHAGTSGYVLSDADGYQIYKYADGDDTTVHTDILMGMALFSDLTITVATNANNGAVTAGTVNVYVAGWHYPDDDSAWTMDVTDLDDYTFPATYGLYKEKVVAAGPSGGVNLGDRVAHHILDGARTNRHYKNEFRHGIEYVKNITTGNFITNALVDIRVLSDQHVAYFTEAALSSGDDIEIGYYQYYRTTAADDLAMEPGDLVRRGHVNEMLYAASLTDRCDFGRTNFPYGDTSHEYVWAPYWWERGMDWTNDTLYTNYVDNPKVTTGYKRLLAFDSVNLTSKKYDHAFYDYTARDGNPDMDETPFFVTGISVYIDQVSVSGGNPVDSFAQLDIKLNGRSLQQAQDTAIRYYNHSNPGITPGFRDCPGALGTESDLVNDTSGGGMFYLPVGLVRCYNFSIDMRIVPGGAWTEIQLKAVYLEGWAIADSGT